MESSRNRAVRFMENLISNAFYHCSDAIYIDFRFGMLKIMNKKEFEDYYSNLIEERDETETATRKDVRRPSKN